MEIIINTDNFERRTMSADCPKCQKTVEADLLNEYDIYTELCHYVPECGAEWHLISYLHCKRLQYSKYEQLAFNIKKKGEGRQERNVLMVIMGINVAIVSAATAGFLAAPALWGARYVYNTYIESQLEDAVHKSYEIDDFFADQNNYYFDKKFLEEREFHRKVLENAKYRSHTPTGFF